MNLFEEYKPEALRPILRGATKSVKRGGGRCAESGRSGNRDVATIYFMHKHKKKFSNYLLDAPQAQRTTLPPPTPLQQARHARGWRTGKEKGKLQIYWRGTSQRFLDLSSTAYSKLQRNPKRRHTEAKQKQSRSKQKWYKERITRCILSWTRGTGNKAK